MPSYKKASTEQADYPINWRQKALNTGENISGSNWTVPSGIEEVSRSFTVDATTIWVRGGTPGERYQLTNRITTSAGRNYQELITIDILEVAR